MNSSAFTEPPSSSTLAISSDARASISSVSASTKYEPANGSTVSAAPDSCATTCWVRTAILADFSLGSASASSKPFVCSDWVPPHTAANACSATREMLFSGCWAVSVTPPVCVWKRSLSDRESVDREPGVDRRLHVGDPAAQRESDLLHRRGPLLAEVVAGDRDRVPPRDVLLAIGEQVRREPHARLGREDEVPARDVLLEDVVLHGAAQLCGLHALLFGDELVEQEQHRRGRVDRHRGR